jgi:hypothetical protein
VDLACRLPRRPEWHVAAAGFKVEVPYIKKERWRSGFTKKNVLG